MKTRLFIITAMLAVLAGPVRAADEAARPAPGNPAPRSPRFKQVRDRVDALYRHRGDAPAPLDPRENPFRPPGAAAASPRAAVAGEPLPPGAPVREARGTDLDRLQESVATLKVSGTFEKDGRLYLVINAKPYKENDVIQAQVRGEAVYLRVRQISRRGVMVVLNEAEMALKF